MASHRPGTDGSAGRTPGQDLRTFAIVGDVPAFRYGQTDGDRMVLGALGNVQNRFSGTTQMEAEQARDLYGVSNPAWLTAYQNSVASVIQLRGFGSHPIYQRYDATDGHWISADVYRAYDAKRWGAFTIVGAVRQDPGNV